MKDKKPENMFPGPNIGEDVNIVLAGNVYINGKVVGLFDDAIVLTNAKGDYEIGFKSAILAMYIKEMTEEEQKKEETTSEA